MNVNLRQIQALVSIARLGSFTKAAKTLHLSQPALTMQIHHLEETLGLRLLDRNTRSVKLTAWGKEVIPVFESVLQALDGLPLNGRDGATESTHGIVSLAALPWVCSTILAPLIAQFRKQHANTSVVLQDASAHQVMAKIRAEEVDIGVACIVEPDPTIRLTPLVVDRLKAVFAPGHPLKHRQAVGVEDLCHYPLIAMAPGTSVRLLVDQGFKSVGHVPIAAYEVRHTSTAIGLVKAGLGFSIVSSSALKLSAAAGVIARPIRHPGFIRTVSVIQKSGRKLSPMADNFLKSMLAKSATWDHP